MKGGQYLNGSWPMNSFWLTIAQAYFKNTTPINNLPTTVPNVGTNTFVRTGANPIPGLWAAP
jgi:hypothetical protein